MAEIVLLRHSFTKGNLEGRYLGGRTDEGLCAQGITLLEGRLYPEVVRIYTSPMKRCIETAKFIWKVESSQMQIVEKLRECDFGDFENKSYQELDGNLSYQAWIDSGGTLPFPGGESMEEFKARCQKGFAEIVKEITKIDGTVALVVHGGTIMAIMERYGFPEQSYFDYQVKNGCGYLLTPVEGTMLWNYQCLP